MSYNIILLQIYFYSYSYKSFYYFYVNLNDILFIMLSNYYYYNHCQKYQNFIFLVVMNDNFIIFYIGFNIVNQKFSDNFNDNFNDNLINIDFNLYLIFCYYYYMYFGLN